MSLEAVVHYIHLSVELNAIRSKMGNDCEEQDAILDEMDVVWKDLSEDEITAIRKVNISYKKTS